MIYDLSEVRLKDVSQVGGKAARLGELIQLGFEVPKGFVLDVHEYNLFLRENQFEDVIHSQLKNLGRGIDYQGLEEISSTIQGAFNRGNISEVLVEEITRTLRNLNIAQAAVRSSATLEDCEYASFAGQHDSYLDVNGPNQILEAVKKCWSSLWGTRSLMYRVQRDISHVDISMAVVIQELVVPDAAGVLFTLHPVTQSDTQMIIEATWGLGEALVSGRVSPDQWVLDATTGEVLSEDIQPKEVVELENIYFESIREKKNLPVIGIKELNELYKIGKKLSSHFSTPQDIEWAYKNGQLYLLQTRPIT